MDSWTESLRRGDNEAFEVLFKKHWQKLVFYAEKMLWDVDDAKDVVQDAFCQLYKCRETIDGLKHVNNFLYLHVKRKCISALRLRSSTEKKNNAALFVLSIDEQLTELDLNWVYAQVIEIVSQLPEHFKTAILNRANRGKRGVGEQANVEYINECRARSIIKKKFAAILKKQP